MLSESEDKLRRLIQQKDFVEAETYALNNGLNVQVHMVANIMYMHACKCVCVCVCVCVHAVTVHTVLCRWFTKLKLNLLWVLCVMIRPGKPMIYSNV